MKEEHNKLRVLRLNSNLVAEMDLRMVTSIQDTLTNQHDRRLEWNLVQSQMPHKFLPFSRYVFMDMNNILVLGGLDDTHMYHNDFFTNYVY